MLKIATNLYISTSPSSDILVNSIFIPEYIISDDSVINYLKSFDRNKVTVLWNTQIKRTITLACISLCMFHECDGYKNALKTVFQIIRQETLTGRGPCANEVRQIARICDIKLHLDLQKKPNISLDYWNCLSVLAKTDFVDLHGQHWKSIEHYVQASKCGNYPVRYQKIKDAKTPSEARNIGNCMVWNHSIGTVEDIVKECSYLKFQQHELSRNQLLETGNLFLVDNDDSSNTLGLILMEIRETLKYEISDNNCTKRKKQKLI